MYCLCVTQAVTQGDTSSAPMLCQTWSVRGRDGTYPHQTVSETDQDVAYANVISGVRQPTSVVSQKWFRTRSRFSRPTSIS